MPIGPTIHPDLHNIDEYIDIIMEILPDMDKPTPEFIESFKQYCYLVHARTKILTHD